MQTPTRLLFVLAALACPLLVSSKAEDLKPACPGCGCCNLKQVCRLIPEVKKETKVKWVLVEEDVCLPGRSCKIGERVVPDCDAPGGCRTEDILRPTCGPIVTKKKLKQTTETIEKQGFKCVVETVCGQCGCSCGSR